MGLSSWLFQAALNRMGAKRLFHRAARARCRELVDELGPRLGNTVRSGPFAGMELPEMSSWGDGDRIAKVLGSYEANLEPAIGHAVARAPATVVNVGCAEGYYAVGLARLLPASTVYAFDIDPRAGAVCRAAAAANGVGDRVVVEGLCTGDRLAELATRPGGVLLVLDCEGAEDELLDPARVSGLSNCDILVETHEFAVPGMVELLESRLAASHSIERIFQGARDPHTVVELAELAEIDRWLAINEGRPESMTWLACWKNG